MKRLARILVVLAALLPGTAFAQPEKQLWGNFTLERIHSPRLSYALAVEPRTRLSGPPGTSHWTTLDVTPSVNYSPNDWFDLMAELVAGRTRHSDGLKRTEITPRIGMRIHLLARIQDLLSKEKQPRRRFVLQNLIRVESRNLKNSQGVPDESTIRLRNRVETFWPIRKQRMSTDGAVYVRADAELFANLSRADTGTTNQRRFRLGVGYRRNFAWRMEVLYVQTGTRNNSESSFETSSKTVSVHVKRVW